MTKNKIILWAGVILIMGTSSLPKLTAAPTKVAATTTQHNLTIDALQGHQVMRDSAGAVEDGVSDIGRPSSGRPRNVYLSGDIVQGGKTLNTAPFLLSATGIQSGLAKASGFPQFLEPGDETGSGGSHIVRILADAVPLEMTIDGTAYSLEADLESDALALAPGSNNTCAVNNANISGDPVWSKTIGEFGYWIDVDAIGSEISTVTGTVQCFKITNGSETEVFIANVEVDNTGTETNRIIPLLRGIGGTNRIVFSDNDTITLLKAHYIFLDNDLETIDTTVNFPTWSATAPTAPETGDYWYDAANETWKRYSGTSWEVLHRIYLGYAIADASGVEWVEHVDFDLSWDAMVLLNQVSLASTTSIIIEGDLKISVAGKQIILKNQHLEQNVSDILESGTTITENAWFYLYVSNFGQLYFSDKCPRKYDERLGLYHPQEYYRCIGFFMTDETTGGDFVLFPIINLPMQNKVIVNTSGEYILSVIDSGINTETNFDVYYLKIPPIVKEALLNYRFIVNAKNLESQVSFKELSQYVAVETYPTLFKAQRENTNNWSAFGDIIIINFVRNSLLGIKEFNVSDTSIYRYIAGFNVKF